jgi:DNA replication and repair protein RecF
MSRMHIRSLSLTNFRNFERLETHLPVGRPLLLYGANAQGKTSLLEAVYVLATGSSPLTSQDRELIRWDAEATGLPYLRVRAEVEANGQLTELEVVFEKRRLANGKSRLQKTFRANRAPKRRVDVVGLLNVVLFVPQDIELVAGGPAVRRRFLDDALCQVDRTYCDALEKYTKALRQRNATLRHIRSHGGDAKQLEPMENSLARHGIVVTDGRHRLVRILSERAGRLQRELTGMREWLRLEYQPGFDQSNAAGPHLDAHDDSRQAVPWGQRACLADRVGAFRVALAARRAGDIERTVTSIGPHRDDVVSISGVLGSDAPGIDLRTFGSRGQQRTAVLAVKLAEMEWIHERSKQAPVLLLDEVLAELDKARREYLFTRVRDVEQCLLTATDVGMFSESFRAEAALWEVRNGTVSSDP